MTAKIQIGWMDQHVAMDTPIDAKDILKTDAMMKAMKHLAVERGGKAARSAGYDLARRIKRVAAMLPDEHAIQLHTTNQCTAPQPWDKWDGLGLELRCVHENYIQWDISLYGGTKGKYRWRYTDDACMRMASNAPHLIRCIIQVKNERRAEHQKLIDEDARKYVESLPEDVRMLQKTARATCIRLSADGQHVTEILHDVEGSMTFAQGHNGFEMPKSLEEMQTSHDVIYHKERK